MILRPVQKPKALRILLPVALVCAGLPFAIRALLPDDPDFAYFALGLGCGVLAATSMTLKSSSADEATELPAAFDPNESGFSGSVSNDPQPANMKDPWVARMTRPFILAFASAVVFVLFRAVPRADSGLPIPMLALLTLAPGLGIVPYLTLRTRRPFASVVFTVFLVASVKLSSCVVVRFVYGPTALEDGYMSADWQTAKLMISLFWIGTVALSGVLAIAFRHRLLRERSPVIS